MELVSIHGMLQDPLQHTVMDVEQMGEIHLAVMVKMMCMVDAAAEDPQEVAVEDMLMGGQPWIITKTAFLEIQRRQNGPGEPAEVYWNSGAYHRGGCAYRLCRVYNQKYWKVTEECFQQGHLSFSGKTSWIYWKPNDEHFYPGGWIPIELKTTRIGTTPEGSEWAKVNLPMKGSSHDNWAFKDLVEVPETLDPGHYVLSFRWDCQQSPQVWNACANIKIV